MTVSDRFAIALVLGAVAVAVLVITLAALVH